jgi:hypothetical protein
LAAIGDEEGFGADSAAYTIFQIGRGGVVYGIKNSGPTASGLFRWLIEGVGFPPFRQKKGERMGHGGFFEWAGFLARLRRDD